MTEPTPSERTRPEPCNCPAGQCIPRDNEGRECWISGYLIPVGYFAPTSVHT